MRQARRVREHYNILFAPLGSLTSACTIRLCHDLGMNSIQSGERKISLIDV